MEAFSWVIARQIFGSGSVGDQPLKKRDDPPSLGPGDVSPQEKRRGRQACQALLLPHDRATGSFHYSSRPEAPGALLLFLVCIEHVGGVLEGLPQTCRMRRVARRQMRRSGWRSTVLVSGLIGARPCQACWAARRSSGTGGQIWHGAVVELLAR
jgi:hypothetical protein